MFLLDTNVISELRRPDRANPNVVKWADGIPAVQFFISAISLLEIERGALQIARKDAAQGRVLRAWVDDHILARFESRILVVDSVVALRCARLHIPDPRSERDALIAATALVHGMTVVTRNVSDFEQSGVNILNPWDVSA
jgi:predicted nucleic acid-binding protein